MKIVTWNVNSVKARHDRLLAFLNRESPDVLCLQELKTPDDQFPHDAVEAAGYQAAVFGQKTYNGVAILSRAAATDVVRGMDDGVDDPQARLIAASVRGVRIICVYVPNGRTVGSDKYEYKLLWLDRLRTWIADRHPPTDPVVLCGDMNVAPEARDVAFPERWEDSVLCHEAARARLRAIADWGFRDLYRQTHPDDNQYSWWDYRRLAFPKGDGLRIDHVFGTPAVADRCRDARIDRNERKGKKPSDHVPVIVELS